MNVWKIRNFFKSKIWSSDLFSWKVLIFSIRNWGHNQEKNTSWKKAKYGLKSYFHRRTDNLLRHKSNLSICSSKESSSFLRNTFEWFTSIVLLLIHFIVLVSFYAPWKHQQSSGFLIFSGGIERDQWHEIDRLDQI